jgi:hypothetical protein
MIVIILIAATAIFIATEGPLGQSIKEGFGLIDKNVDFTLDVKSRNGYEAKEVFSQGAMYVYHRASNDGCKENGGPGTKPTVWHQNNGKISDPKKGIPNTDGYPALEGSFLSRYPECAGRRSTAVRGKGNNVQDTGNDMEGIFSRLNFKVHEKFTLTAGSGDTWMERSDARKPCPTCPSEFERLLSVSEASFERSTKFKSEGGCLNSGPGYTQTWDGFIVYFATSKDIDDRAESSMQDNGLDIPGLDTVYCTALGPGANQAAKYYKTDKHSGKVEVTFCPGDEGYIEVRKGDPWNRNEAGETDFGATQKWAYIQITKIKEKSC